MVSNITWFRTILFIIILYFVFNSKFVLAQSIQDTWDIPSYHTHEYSDLYGSVYFAPTLDEWEMQVETVLSNSIVVWQEEANQHIETLLRNEHSEDDFISNEGYVDERRRSLLSEVSIFYSEWERDLLNDYFINRNAFLEKLETGKIDALYFQRLGKEDFFNSYTEEEISLNENREKILQAAEEWEYQWENSRQEGLNSFASSLEKLNQDYLTYLNSLQETENQFLTNLQVISEYRETVYIALFSMLEQMKFGVESSCEVDSGCLYRNQDGSLNEAGIIFSKFINELSDELLKNDKNPDLLLSNVAWKMNEFLSLEANKAFAEQTYFKDRIYTYQTGFQIDLDQTKSNFDLGHANWVLRNQNYHQLGSDVKYENWGFVPGDVGIFSGVYDSELRSIFQSIHHSNFNHLTEIINSKLGDHRKVQNLISANLYTDAYHFINNFSLMGLGVPFETAHHVQGNLMLDGTTKYGYWQAERNFTIFTPGTYSYQMGAIGYSVLYEMYDDTSYQSSLYWDSNFSQLKQQSRQFEGRLLPAISHWETKVKEYADAYKNWTESKENLVEEAKQEYQKNRISLEITKEKWIQQLEVEKDSGWKSWNQLYQTGELSSTSPKQSSLKFESNLHTITNQTALSQFQSSSQLDETINDIQVGEHSLLDHFQKTIIGVNQYASVVQMNHELYEFQKSEQNKLLNQYSYALNSDFIGNRKLTKEELVLIGNADFTQLTEMEQKNFGRCYTDPTEGVCKNLLKKEYEVSVHSDGGSVRVSKEIYNGMLAEKNNAGEYNASKSLVSKQILFSSIGKIQGSDRKDLFTEWSEEDWNSLYDRKNQIAQSFVQQSLKKDQISLASNFNAIESLNERNYSSYLVKKESQENVDSFVQELALAYLTGGISGVKASLNGKIESSINSELAKVWIKATGGNEEHIQMATMAIDFMRGRMSAKKINARDQFISIKNPIQSLETVLGNTLSSTIEVMDKVSNGLLSVPLNLALSGVMAITKEVIGERSYQSFQKQTSGANTRLEEIKRNEESIAESGISQVIASATGLPLETISKLVSDTRGQYNAKKAKQQMSKDLVSNLGSQITGALGGILKTAVLALGIPEDEIYQTLSDAHSFANAKNVKQGADTKANYGYTLQTFGLQAGWTKHQSSLVDLKDSNAVMTEIGKTILSKEISKSSGMEESFVRQSLDGMYGKYIKKKSDKKAQNNAIRQTVVNGTSIALTLGASGVWSGASSALSKVGKFANAVTRGAIPATAKVGQVVTSTLLQTVAGSHEGKQGAIAGFLNGSLVGLTDKFGKFESGLLKGTMPGIGVTYSEQSGWGGSFGIGNSINNLNVSFSKKGNSSLQFSQSIAKGIQFAVDMTTNETWKLGLNYNPTGEGPRKDWNYSMMYDLKGSGLSGSLGYTEPNSKLGINNNLDSNGITSTSELQGVNIGTNSKDGFQMEDFNFANQNINIAQDGSDLLDQNGNAIENLGDSPLSELWGQLGTVGGVLLGGMGLFGFVMNRMNGGGGNSFSVGSDFGQPSFLASSDRSLFSRVTDPIKNGFSRIGDFVSRFTNVFKVESSTSNSNGTIPEKQSNENPSAIEILRITKLKKSILDDYHKDSRIVTEKKLYELKRAGVDTSEIETAIKVKRNGKDVPISKSDLKSLNEYKRLRELRSVRPIGAEDVPYVSSSDALAKIDATYDPKKETREVYLQRLGNLVCAASKDVDLSTDKLVALHTANVANLLGENLMGKIGYSQYKLIKGEKVVSAVNPVGEDGFRQIYETDCIRYIGAVLYAAGLTDNGSFANLNTEVYLTPEEMENMEAEYKKGNVHRNGVEYFRQAGGFSNLVSERLTTEADLKAHKKKGVIPELKVGMIGVTRKMSTDEDTKHSAMKSDHIYIIIGKKFNPELGVNEYLISESSYGKGVQNRWITAESKDQIKQKLEKRYEVEGIDKKKAKVLINKHLNNLQFIDYLPRSEFYELKPQNRNA
ncbi:TIGR04388 family protein [Leptospira sp. WS39.C2]